MISDKLTSCLMFVDEVLLHVSRGVRWDSDHVVIMNEELKAIAEEVIRHNYDKRVHIGLDYFDASINRIMAWTIGARNMSKALLMALVEPAEQLRDAENSGDFPPRADGGDQDPALRPDLERILRTPQCSGRHCLDRGGQTLRKERPRQARLTSVPLTDTAALYLNIETGRRFFYQISSISVVAALLLESWPTSIRHAPGSSLRSPSSKVSKKDSGLTSSPTWRVSPGFSEMRFTAASCFCGARVGGFNAAT